MQRRRRPHKALWLPQRWSEISKSRKKTEFLHFIFFKSNHAGTFDRFCLFYQFQVCVYLFFRCLVNLVVELSWQPVTWAPDWYQTSTGRKLLCTLLEYYYSSVIQTLSLCFFAVCSNRRTSKKTSGHQSTSKHVSLILRKHSKLPMRNWVTSSYLSEVPDVKKVEGLKQLAFPHAKHVTARHQECPDVLQAQKLCWEDRKGWSEARAVWHPGV